MPWEYFDRPATEVESNIAIMNGRADDALNKATAALDALSQFDPGAGAGNPPTTTLPPIVVPPVVTPTIPRADGGQFGGVNDINLPAFQDLFAQLGITLADLEVGIPTFNSPIGNLNIPTAPAALDTSDFPVRPSTPPVTVPDAPNFILPDIGDLAQITVPDFVFPELPTFNAAAPLFDGVQPSALIFAEPAYASEELTAVKADLAMMLAGGTGLTVEVQQALFDAARSREEQTALGAKQEAFDEWAGRGFAMPPGMLVRAVDAAVERAQLQSNALSREILTKSAQWEIENLRFAVQHGTALETQLINLFNNSVQRSFEAARFRVEADQKLYDAAVTLFNARQNAYSVAAQVFKTLTDGALAKLEAYKAQIQGELAKSQLNEQVVRVYQARLSGVRELIEVFKSRMQGAQLEAEVGRQILDGYRIDVQAAGEKIQAKKTAFDAYDSQMRGEQAKASMYEAYSRAFGETVRAAEVQGNIKLSYVNARIAAIRASVEQYTADVNAQRAVVAGQVSAIQARAAAFSADVSRYTAELGSVNEGRRVELEVSEQRLRNNLAYFETLLHEYDAGLARSLQRSAQVLEAMKTSGTISATLAAGAMSAIHVQASMSGSSQVSDGVRTETIISRQGADVP